MNDVGGGDEDDGLHVVEEVAVAVAENDEGFEVVEYFEDDLDEVLLEVVWMIRVVPQKMMMVHFEEEHQ